MDDLTGAAVAGAAAGAAVAVPLGAVGVLLVREAIDVGWWPASAGAIGVALVDLAYAAVAVLAGAAVGSALTGRESFVRLAGAVLLVGIGVHGLRRVWRERFGPPAAVVGPGSSVSLGPVRSGLRTATRFVVLTAVNPLTAVYFGALAAGSGAATGRPTAFLVGVFAASLLWQFTLVGTGALVGVRLGRRARVVTGLVGNLVVLGYAAAMAVTAIVGAAVV